MLDADTVRCPHLHPPPGASRRNTRVRSGEDRHRLLEIHREAGRRSLRTRPSSPLAHWGGYHRTSWYRPSFVTVTYSAVVVVQRNHRQHSAFHNSVADRRTPRHRAIDNRWHTDRTQVGRRRHVMPCQGDRRPPPLPRQSCLSGSRFAHGRRAGLARWLTIAYIVK